MIISGDDISPGKQAIIDQNLAAINEGLFWVVNAIRKHLAVHPDCESPCIGMHALVTLQALKPADLRMITVVMLRLLANREEVPDVSPVE